MQRRFNSTNIGAISLVWLSIAGVALASTGLFLSYSYWFDELYSVTAAQLPLDSTFALYILPDVHPPLYAVALRLWVLLFGVGEIATRSLSFIFALGALLIVAWYCWRWLERPIALSAIAIFSTGWLFAYYAQETRSYAFILFLSAATTGALGEYIRARRARELGILLAAAFLLAWTHYFGLVYAGIALAAALFWSWPSFGRISAICIVALACLAWPVVHYLYGVLGNDVSGFWIESNGIQTTLSLASQALVPQINIALKALVNNSWRLEQAIAGAFAGVLLVIAVMASRHSERRIWGVLAVLVIALVATIAAIDRIAPVSTPRNFIVVWPPMAMLLAVGLHQLPSRRLPSARLAAVAALCVSSLAITYGKVLLKEEPIQNLLGASRFIDRHVDAENSAGAYFLSGKFGDNPAFARVTRFYAQSNLQPVTARELSTLEVPFYVLVLQQPEKVERLRQSIAGLEVYEPEQAWSDAVVLYATERDSLASSAVDPELQP